MSSQNVVREYNIMGIRVCFGDHQKNCKVFKAL